MRNLLLLIIISLICMAAGCGGGGEKPEKPSKSPEELKKQREDSLKNEAKATVKDFFDLLKKKEYKKAKEKVEEVSLPNLEIVIAEAEKYKQENNIQEPIEIEVLETILVAPNKVNCKTRCRIKDKEVIHIIPVIIIKDRGCRVVCEADHLPIYRFVVFCNRYDVIVINYNRRHHKYDDDDDHYKKKKKKKKNHPRGNAYGHHRGDDDDGGGDDDD